MRMFFTAGLFLLTLGLAGCSDDDPVGAGSGHTLRVPAQFEKIQQAIEAAEPGDVVLVAPGTYTDTVAARNMLGGNLLVCIDLKSVVEVRGETGRAEDVILRGNPVHPVVNCVDVNSTASLVGLTITGGRTGIAGGRSAPNIVNCVFEANHNLTEFGAGGGMYWDFSSPAVTNCVFTDNSAPYGGGAVFANDSKPVLINCIFSGNTAGTTPNTAGTAGALGVSGGCQVKLTNCLFNANHADSLGGAIEVHESSLNLVNCQMTGNDTGGMGGAVFVNYGGQVDLSNGLVEGNSAAFDGGGFYLRAADTRLFALNSRVRNNLAPVGPDGFLQNSLEPAEVTFRCCDIDRNRWIGSVTLDNAGCD